jgi:hypothetical protein
MTALALQLELRVWRGIGLAKAKSRVFIFGAGKPRYKLFLVVALASNHHCQQSHFWKIGNSA